MGCFCFSRAACCVPGAWYVPRIFSRIDVSCASYPVLPSRTCGRQINPHLQPNSTPKKSYHPKPTPNSTKTTNDSDPFPLHRRIYPHPHLYHTFPRSIKKRRPISLGLETYLLARCGEFYTAAAAAAAATLTTIYLQAYQNNYLLSVLPKIGTAVRVVKGDRRRRRLDFWTLCGGWREKKVAKGVAVARGGAAMTGGYSECGGNSGRSGPAPINDVSSAVLLSPIPGGGL